MNEENNTDLIEEQDKQFDADFAEFAAVEDGSKEALSGNGEDELETPGTKAAAKPAAAKEADIWENASPAQKAAFEETTKKAQDLDHKLKSDAGRVSALQIKANNLEKTLREQKPSGPRIDKDAIKEALKDPEQWESFKDQYPEIGEAVDAVLGHRLTSIKEEIRGEFKQQTDSLQKAIGPIAQENLDREQKKQYDLLVAPVEDGGFGHADFVTIKDDPEFLEWMANQSGTIQSLTDSESASDAAFVLNAYKAAKGITTTPKIESTGDDLLDKTDPVKEVGARRAKQLAQGESIPSTGRVPKTGGGGSGDFDSDFAFFAKQEAKKMKAATP